MLHITILARVMETIPGQGAACIFLYGDTPSFYISSNPRSIPIFKITKAVAG